MSVGDSFFVDSNILLYQFDGVRPEKQYAADQWMTALWEGSAGRISWQVIHEFYANGVRRLAIPAPTARSAVNRLIEWRPLPPLHTTIERAWHWCDTAQVNFWDDAMIVDAAEQSGCQWLLSEDFQQRFASVTVVSPFARRPAEFRIS